MMLWLRGYSDQALARCQDAMALAERVAHPFSMALAQLHCSYVHLFRREPDEVRRRVDKWIALSKEFGLSPTMMADGRFQLGWALAEEGHAAEGVREMREAIAAIAATGTAIGRQYLLCVLARACGEFWRSERGTEPFGESVGDRKVRRQVSIP